MEKKKKVVRLTEGDMVNLLTKLMNESKEAAAGSKAKAQPKVAKKTESKKVNESNYQSIMQEMEDELMEMDDMMGGGSSYGMEDEGYDPSSAFGDSPMDNQLIRFIMTLVNKGALDRYDALAAKKVAARALQASKGGARR